MEEMRIIAHRGASGSCPENTLLAFRRALEVGARWLELDVQLVENELVVFHDEELERTTNGRGLLAECSLAQLRELDAGRGERVPLLTEVLELAHGRARVNIELKGPGSGAATARLLEKLFNDRKLEADEILASSLRMEELGSFQQLMPQVRCAPVFDELPGDWPAQLEELGAWSVHLHKSLITEAVIEQARKDQRYVFAWTVNRKRDAKKLEQLGVDGIFTDHPERFIIRKN